MRASTWIVPRAPRRRALALAAVIAGSLVACSDIPPIAGVSAPLKDGDAVQSEGTAEVSVQAPGSAKGVTRAASTWRARATMQGGIARPDFERRGLAARDPARDRDGAESQADAEARVLGELAPALLGPLVINEDARLASFGRKSVLHQTLDDGGGRTLDVYAISELTHGPMTDILLVRDGKAVGLHQVTWARDHGVWRAVGARLLARRRDGSRLTARVSVTGAFAAAGNDSSTWASLDTRAEEMRFASFAATAAHVLLPATAGAQTWGPVDCSLYRNRFVQSTSPCLAYGLNKAGAPLLAYLGVLGSAFARFSPTALSELAAARGMGAVIALLEGAGDAVVATAAADWVAFAAAALLIYAMYNVIECLASHGPTITLCTAGSGGGSGSGGGPTPGWSPGDGDGTCDALCDVQTRDIVNQLRAQAYANSQEQ
ncbi:MAG: hypothetical protein HY275_05410 [Gemmatimonadetes bacterium]|nr:hypothetical protein [Gemmatimonadota bacterium]